MAYDGRLRSGSTSSLSSQAGNDYTMLPYYYSNFKDSNEVADFLKHKSKGKAGHFLVRPSFKRPNCLTVSVVVKDKSVRHTNIVIEIFSAQSRQFYLVPEKRFPTVADLIVFYKENDVTNLEKVKNVRFLYPVLRTSSRFSDTGSLSSGGSFSQIEPPPREQQIQVPDDRPKLPPRPDTLPRKPSGSSFGSQVSLPRNPSDMSPGWAPVGSLPKDSPISPFGSIPRDSPFGSSPKIGASISHNGFQQRGASFDEGPVAERPPAPIPPGVHKIDKDKDPYYSRPRNTDEDISEKLKEVLRENERCDCGIPRDMSELPMGWTLHRSKDQPTYGRIFYQNSTGLTSWKLPEEVAHKLTPTQKGNLKKLQIMFKNPSSSSYLMNSFEGESGNSGNRSSTGNTHF